jgi:hypothetical protein
MDDYTQYRRYVRPAGRFKCKAADGSTGHLNAMMEFERVSDLPSCPEEPLGWVLFWQGKRVKWIAKGRYLTPDGVELTARHRSAP